LTYQIAAYVGIGLAVIGFLIIREPERNKFDKTAIKSPQADQRSTLAKFGAAMLEIFTNPTCRWVAIGGAFRFFGGYAIGFYMPQYFGKFDGPNDSNIYAYGNAIVVSMCGFASALLGGIISDKFEKKGFLTIKSTLVIGSSLLGIPFIVLCTCV